MKDLNLGKKQASGQKWSFLNQDLPALPFFSQYVNFSKVSFMIQFFNSFLIQTLWHEMEQNWNT